MEFLEAVTRAELRMIAQWHAHIPRDWRAARDFLARRYPERWGLRVRVGLDHDGEVTHVHEVNSITNQLIADPDFLITIQIAADQILEKRQDNHSHG